MSVSTIQWNGLASASQWDTDKKEVERLQRAILSKAALFSRVTLYSRQDKFWSTSTNHLRSGSSARCSKRTLTEPWGAFQRLRCTDMKVLHVWRHAASLWASAVSHMTDLLEIQPWWDREWVLLQNYIRLSLVIYSRWRKHYKTFARDLLKEARSWLG